ncbi:DUF4097 family beta strand repeat-containing protein [Actinoplanes sp. NBRC 103695]|uniref:DUF4097 family beta strand repeat-containing protein n=1 Tax=Actinoplanes sp. NBRC 103695 TaxID=3032202 RepID=UPI0024A2328D|nr:DUF4097 family beta strand repeat-containing protein [Actinoplanes sp. NBRC 103695]GLZ00609.1 hypothetical protein Acsp02_78610 [Actinoplanes sp. NBRC 103695]
MPEFDHSTPVTVALSVHAGQVDITAEDRVSVLAEVRPMDGSEASRQAAENTQISLDGDTLTVRAPEHGGWSLRRSGKLHVVVRVPADSTLACHLASADLKATGRYAAAQVKIASGDVRLDDVTGDALIESASGDLTVGRVGGSLRGSSASGDLRIGDVNGDVSAESASGDITIRGAGTGAAVKTASGDIEVGTLRAGEARINSASGDVKVGVLAGTGVWLDVSTASGKTRNELSMGGDAPGATPESTGAQLELRIRTASGDITIRRATAPTRAAA